MKKRFTLIWTVLLIGWGFTGSLAWAQETSPMSVAENFVKAYFMLDSSMAGYLSEDARTDEDGRDTVELYLRIRETQARSRGYDPSYLRMFPILTKTEILDMDDSSATVKLDLIMIRNINPLYRAVGYVFRLLREHEFQAVVDLVKENGEWKIGPGALDMPV